MTWDNLRVPLHHGSNLRKLSNVGLNVVTYYCFFFVKKYRNQLQRLNNFTISWFPINPKLLNNFYPDFLEPYRAIRKFLHNPINLIGQFLLLLLEPCASYIFNHRTLIWSFLVIVFFYFWNCNPQPIDS